MPLASPAFFEGVEWLGFLWALRPVKNLGIDSQWPGKPPGFSPRLVGEPLGNVPGKILRQQRGRLPLG